MYGSKTIPQIMGTGQGNGCAPTAWCLISSKMIQMMKNHNYGVQLQSALSQTLFNIVCFAFVDNTYLPMTAPTVDTPGKDLQESFQETLDQWAGALATTGGELDPKKSWCYIIDFL